MKRGAFSRGFLPRFLFETVPDIKPKLEPTSFPGSRKREKPGNEVEPVPFAYVELISSHIT